VSGVDSMLYASNFGNLILLIILSVTNKYISVIGIHQRMSQKVSAFLRDSAWVNEILDHVRMPAVKCKFGVKPNATSLDALSAIKVPSANDSDAS